MRYDLEEKQRRMVITIFLMKQNWPSSSESEGNNSNVCTCIFMIWVLYIV